MGNSLCAFGPFTQRSKIEHPRRLLLPPWSHKGRRHHQFLTHLTLILIRETHLQIGVATKVESKERMTQTPPLVFRLIQGYLEHTGIDACPLHQMDRGVRDPDCDYCKRALGPLYHHKIKGNRRLPVFTFDFSGPHPDRVNVAQYLLVRVWSLGHMRLVWAFGVESRQAPVVLPCLQSSFEDLRALTGGQGHHSSHAF